MDCEFKGTFVACVALGRIPVYMNHRSSSVTTVGVDIMSSAT